MANVPNPSLSVKSCAALPSEVHDALLSLRVAAYGNEALALSVSERIAPLPASADLERAQALSKLAEEHAARLRESVDVVLARLGLLAR